MRPTGSLLERPWRVGRHEPRHVYAMHGEAARDDDTEVLVAIGPERQAHAVATYIVKLHNDHLAKLELE